jgi:hypothetical protein
MKTILFLILLVSGLFFTVYENALAHHTKEHSSKQTKTNKED